jgi:O-glycosyl hydrolase
MNRIFITIFLLSTLCFAGFSQTVNVQVYPEILKQKIESIGGNYCQANYTSHAWDAIGEVTLSEFRPSHVRLALPLQFENQPYETYKGKKIVEQPTVITLLEAMKRMKTEFGVTNFTISVWRVPNAVVDKPERNDKRRIKPEHYAEVIDMIEAFLTEAKTKYGVEADYFSFNESDGGYMTIFSPEETIVFFKMAADRFQKAGLKTKFLWADTAQTLGTVEFATMIAADSTIWKYLGPLCFHSWWSEKIPDSEFERIAGFAKAWNRPVWCSELGFDAMSWRTKGMNESWDYAFRFAKISHRMMKYAEVEVSMYWTWQNNYGIMSADTKTKYPSYYITRHYTDFLNSGTQIIHSLSSDPEIFSICGINKEGKYVIQIINLKKEPVNVEIAGITGKLTKSVTTTEKNNWKENDIQVKVSGDKIVSEIQSESLNTLVF